MSTAQVAMPGLSVTSTPSRSMEGRRSDSGPSFQDAIDSAVRSQDTAEDKSSSATGDMSPDQNVLNKASRDSADGDAADRDSESALSQDGQVFDLSLMLAALNGTPKGESSPNSSVDIEGSLPRALTGPAFGGLGLQAADGAPLAAADLAAAAEAQTFDAKAAPLPGAVSDGEEVSFSSRVKAVKDKAETIGFGAPVAGEGEMGTGIGSVLAGDGLQTVGVDTLLNFLKPKVKSVEAPGSVATDVTAVEDITVKVLQQETHLALKSSPDVMTRVAERASLPSGVQTAPVNIAGVVQNQAVPGVVGTPGPKTQLQDAVSMAGATADATMADALGARDVTVARAGSGESQAQAQSGQGQNSGGSAAFLAALDGGFRLAGPGDAGAEADDFLALSDQIATEVRAELAADGVGKTSSDGVVKVLHLELKPANLGAVTVRIALKDNAVTLHIEAQRRETQVAIERDRDALIGALNSAGYTVDGIAAAPLPDGPRATTAFGVGGGSVGAGAGDQAGQQAANNSSSGQRESGQSQAGTDRQTIERNVDAAQGARTTADALYV